MAVTTSIRMPDALHEQYETLARATGRSRNELMVEALRSVAEHQLREIAMIQEGLGIPIADAVVQFIAEGVLSADFRLTGDARPSGA
jgi:predicted transcriptional regulator